MTIQEVIRECVVALFKDELLERTLVLKGGTALHLIENIDSRLSTDIDFSACEKISSPDLYFERVTKALGEHFLALGFEVFDSAFGQKPKERTEKHPEFWAGWFFEFKLSRLDRQYKSLEDKRRSAMVPDGGASSKIRIEISEYEYCGSTRKVVIHGSAVVSYSGVLLVAEKIRAICQQHPDYPYGSLKNRARDFYDVYQLVRKYRSPQFHLELKSELPKVFAAKQVDLALLRKIFDPGFLSFQASHFSSVETSVSGKTEPFDFYSEQLKLLLNDIGMFDLMGIF